MHELSIAEAVVRIACDHAAGRGLTRVEVRIGHLRQVVPSALEFAFELVAQGTPAEGSVLAIEHVPAEGVCAACGARTALDGFPLQCAACGGLQLELVAGEELLVDAVEVEDLVTTTDDGRMLHGR